MTVKQYILLVVLGIALFFIGMLAGRCTKSKGEGHFNTIEEVRYEKLPDVGGIIYNPDPINEHIPSIPELVFFKDTVYLDSITYVLRDVDSLKILQDYLTRRQYDLIIFDEDTLGKCEITAETFRNRLSLLGYKYTPVQKIVEVKPQYEIFGGIGVNTGNEISINAGLFRNNLGFGYTYTRNFNLKDNYHGLTILYKIKLK